MPQIHKEQSILLGEITGCLICPLPHQGQDQCEAAPGEEPSLGKQSQHKQSHLPWNKLELIFFFFLLCSSFVSKDISSENRSLAWSGG